MEETSQLPYPSMLGSLEPAQAVQAVNDRVKRIGKVNAEIADWLLERRKVEDAYVQGLKKLAGRALPGSNSELGIFTAPWQRVVSSIESIAASHHTFAHKIDTDVETPLRTFASQNKAMLDMSTVQSNLSTIAKELTEAQEKAGKLSKKGGKASAHKVEAAATRLDSATTSWEAQAPFIFEQLQSLDELRLNTLRDTLTQYETLEVDCIERNRSTVESTIGSIIEVDTQTEISNWATNVTMGKQKREKLAGGSSSGGERRIRTSSGGMQPPPPLQGFNDNASQRSGRNNHDGASDLQSSSFSLKKSKLGTMINRRRQSINSGFARAGSPSKGFAQFGGRGSDSRDGPSPRTSSANLQESANKHLSTLPESPVSPRSGAEQNSAGNINGDPSSGENGTLIAERIQGSGAAYGNLPDLTDVQPPPGPPPSHFKNTNTGSVAEPQQDSEGFTVRPTANDPISQAEQDAADEAREQQFKLDIRNEPIKEEDADAQAALSNVANTLRMGTSNLATPSRKAGTVRGRRDVRNTVYLPAGSNLDVLNPDSHGGIPPSPNLPLGIGMAAPSTSDMSHVSDAQSVRSSRSAGARGAIKHPDMHNEGLNASIVEKVNSTFENGEITSSSVDGEIALAFNIGPSTASATETSIRLTNFQALEAIGPTWSFVKAISPDRPGEYILNNNAISKPTAVCGFQYKVHIDDANRASFSPILVKPAWKAQGHNLSLILEYKLNPAYSNEPTTTLHNLGFVVSYEGQRASVCQMKPTGTHVKGQRTVYWRLGDTTFSRDNETWHKAIARLVGAEGAEPQPGVIEGRWEIPGVIGTSLGISQLKPEGKGKAKVEADEDDPFADDTIEENGGQWVEMDVTRRLVSAKYYA